MFDFPFAINKLPLEVELAKALLQQVHVAALCRCRIPVEQAQCAAKFDTIVGLRFD
jgi:hypothetical protein